ncbi:MAG TPA: hypothetical protein VGI72_14665 [Gaiellales bacterium]|jgi:hypothetical protein
MLGWVLALLGLGALLTAVVAVVVGGLLLGPLLVWLAWNVLGLAGAVGAGELGFWGLVLVAVFLAVGMAGRVLIVAVVFLVDPAWLHRSATLHWPAPTLRNFVAICLLLAVASASARPHREWQRKRPRDKPVMA